MSHVAVVLLGPTPKVTLQILPELSIFQLKIKY